MALAKVHLYSSSLGMQQTCYVILPQRRDTAAGRKLPVLWLLHGMHGSFASWQRQSSIERYAHRLGLAVVMPDGENSFYTNMAHGMKYRDWIADELPQKLRGMFNLSDKREDNFIAGLSMGGMGSFHLGLSMPERYAAIGALSCPIFVGGSYRIRSEKYLKPVMGDSDLIDTVYDAKACAERILREGLPCPRIFHMCGEGDSLLPTARETRDLFEGFEGNPFDYVYREAQGAHEWSFWDRYIQVFLDYLHLPENSGEFL